MDREFATHHYDLPHRYSPPAFNVGKEKVDCVCGRPPEDELHHAETAREQAADHTAKEVPREFG